jgi:cytochrome c biogenesis protein CcmG/thiol:disulfide interchange protein DsbE
MEERPHELAERPQSRREWSGWLRSIVLPIAVLVAIVGGLFWYQSRSSGGGGSAYGTVDLPAALKRSGPVGSDKGDTAPDFLLQTLDGKTLRLSDLRGHPVLVNFWATWCVSCREEMPNLIQAYDANKGKGLVIVGVNLQEADERARQFAQDFQVDYPIAMDRSGEVARTWRIGGPTQGLPASYFIDKDGVVQKVVWGAVRTKDLSEGLGLIMGQN